MTVERTPQTGYLSKRGIKKHKYSQLIENIYGVLNDELLRLLNNLLINSKQSLVKQEKNIAQAISHDSHYKIKAEQKHTLFALEVLHAERKSIHKNFFRCLNDQLLPTAVSAFDEEGDNLRLVDNDEMEEMVAITSMHSNALNLFGDDIHDLEARLEFLEIMSAPIFGPKAINPNRICEAFQLAIKPFDFKSETKVVLFKYFDEHVNLKLAPLYQTINNLLIEAGVLPELIRSSRNNYQDVEEKKPKNRAATYYNPQEYVATNFIPRSQDEMNSIVSQFVNGDISITGNELKLPASFSRNPNRQRINNKQLYAKKDVLQSLSKLQNEFLTLGSKSKLENNNQIKNAMLKEMDVNDNSHAEKEMAILDERSIDFVGMMFDAICEDESISPVITSLINKLQIPIIKVAVNDDELFSNDQHPARNVLNLIPQAGKGVIEQNDHIYSELDDIVNNILDEYEIDTACFENAVDTLYDLIENEERLTKTKELKEQRTIIREYTRSVILTELKGLTKNKTIPPEVQPLVLKNWSTLMFHRHIKHGKDSYQWMESVLLLKLLMKCLQPIKRKSQWEFLNKNHLSLVESVNDELYNTKQNKEDIDTKLASLSKIFLAMLTDYGYEMVDGNQGCEIESMESNLVKELELIKQQAQKAVEKIKQLPNNVKSGVWFEVFNGDGKSVRRVKMSTILTEAAKIIFVDRKGVKIIEKDAGDFAEELNQNLSRVLADHSTFEHALSKVIGSMAA